jgi:hypothetical protein
LGSSASITSHKRVDRILQLAGLASEPVALALFDPRPERARTDPEALLDDVSEISPVEDRRDLVDLGIVKG